jgi:hypothetical protein
VVADAEQRRQRQAPPTLLDGYATQYGQLPGHGLTFDVPLSHASEAAVLEAGLALGGGNPTTSTSTIVSASIPSLYHLIPAPHAVHDYLPHAEPRSSW